MSEVADSPDGPIGRGEAARRRILTGAFELLADEGMSGFTMEAVARRSGASKATVYRHWESRTALLIDVTETAIPIIVPPTTGRLREDLVGLLSTPFRDQAHPRIIAAFVDAAEQDPALRPALAELSARRRDPVRHVLIQACHRRDLPADLDLELALDLLTAPIFYRRFVGHSSIDAQYIVRLVDQVLAVIACDKPPR